MFDRNLKLVRSIGFGVIAKIAGAFVVFIGLPIIATRLDPTSYKLFLYAMSASSFTTIIFGALNLSTSHKLANEFEYGQLQNLEKPFSQVISTYIGVGIIVLSILIALTALANFSPPACIVFLACAISVLQGIFQLGDTGRVALRQDHISSSFQVIGSVAIFVLLLTVPHLTVLNTVLVYFAVPCLLHITIFVHLVISSRWRIKLDLTALTRTRLDKSTRMLLANSLLEYCKIFGIGIFFSFLSSPQVYARFQTEVLMVIRLINPLSLLTRPLLPAYIDAIKSGDAIWLQKVSRLATALYILATFLIIPSFIAIYALNARWGIFPNFPFLNMSSIIGLGLLLVGQFFTVLLLPLYIAKNMLRQYLTVNAISLLLSSIIGSISVLFPDGWLTMTHAIGIGVLFSSTFLLILFTRPNTF